jgi:hypothetical protein
MESNNTLIFLLVASGVIGLALSLFFAGLGFVTVAVSWQESDRFKWRVITYTALFFSMISIAAISFGIYMWRK